jgi:hypothetical protein
MSVFCRAKARGQDRWLCERDGLPGKFQSRYALCRELARVLGVRWRNRVSLVPLIRRERKRNARETKALRVERDMPYGVCPPVVDGGIRHLHSWKRPGDDKMKGMHPNPSS